jgi:class 3 adenylate cyclase/TolB-like protein
MTQKTLNRKLAAILAADVVGYSRLMGKDEEGTFARLTALRADVVDPIIASHGGRVVKLMGDGTLAEFKSVIDAVSCAVALQDAHTDYNNGQADDEDIHLRIGINVGDVIVDGDDIYGDGVNVAARLESIADTGGICLSGSAYDQVVGKIEQSLEFLGDQSLKNIEAPVRAYKVQLPNAAAAVGPSATTPEIKHTLDFALPSRPTIAILPFKNLGSDQGQDYLADGVRLGIQATLVQLSGMFLVNASAMNSFKDTNTTPMEAGDTLDVQYILDGAVQQSGDRVRVTVQLTDVAGNRTQWAEKYDRVIDDVFKLQDEITQEVISELDVQLISGEINRIWFDRLTSPKAREYYYRGCSHLYGNNRADNAAARRMFEKLYEVQPNVVHGPSNVAITHWLDFFFGWSDDLENSKDEARAWAEKAIKYEDNNGMGFVVLGHLKLLEGDHEDALDLSAKGIELRFCCPVAHGVHGMILNYAGEGRTAVKCAREALNLERIYPSWLITILATAYRDSGAINLSVPAARESARLEPDSTDARLVLCSDYEMAGEHEKAGEMASEILATTPSFTLANFAKTQPYKNTEALQTLVGALRAAGLPE